MTAEFGRGFDERNLRHMRSFYQSFQNWYAVRSELSWTHYRALLRVDDPHIKTWYLNEAVQQNWRSRALERQNVVRGASAVHVQWSDRYLTQMEHLAKQRQAGETALQNFRDDNLEELAQFVEEVDLFAVNPHFRGEQI